MIFHLDCRFFIGEKPCKYNRLCDECPHYAPVAEKILVVGLYPSHYSVEAQSFVSQIASAYKNSFITWLADESDHAVLKSMHSVGRVVCDSFETELRLKIEQFDILFYYGADSRTNALVQAARAAYRLPAPFLMRTDVSAKMKTVSPAAYPERIEPPAGKPVRILIVKLGAMGDVIRTTPILSALRKRYPSYELTWLVDANSAIFLSGNTAVHRIVCYGNDSVAELLKQQFDVVYSLDKEVRAAAVASLVDAPCKCGVGFDASGSIYPFNALAHYSFSLGMSDRLKFFENEKTYQREILDMLGFAGEPYGAYELPMDNFDLPFGQKLLTKQKEASNRFVVGLNTGAGEVFATKRYDIGHYITLIRLLVEKAGATVLILGGPSEIDRNRFIIEQCAGVPHVVDAGCHNPLEKFMGIVNACDVVVTGDTLALHLALALKRRVVALFGSTCAQEIDLYGLGEKIVSLPDCAPCYKRMCPNEDGMYMICMRRIAPESVFEAVQRQRANMEINR
ncbi:glycosyltransferase family 9 protein [bacterium]|nr:glycosyltransferase family 9 protein [bacterium]